MFFTQLALRKDSFIDFVRRNVSGTFREVGVLLLDVSVKMEIIDFLLPRIKQKLLKNITITPQKNMIGTDYVQPLSQFMRVKLGACFGLGPFTLDIMIKTMIRQSFFEVAIQSRGGELESGRNVTGMFLWTKLINESSLTFLNLLDALRTEVVKTEV